MKVARSRRNIGNPGRAKAFFDKEHILLSRLKHRDQRLKSLYAHLITSYLDVSTHCHDASICKLITNLH